MNPVRVVIDSGQIAAPLLKFVGGKRQLLPEIRKHVPPKFGCYFEPFVGGGAVFFDLHAAGRIDAKHRAWLGDSNLELITTYSAIETRLEETIGVLRNYEKRHSEKLFYEMRARPMLPPDKAAVGARMIYLNRTCFNGLYRVNKKGLFNVPFGKYANPTICDEANLRACSRAFKVAALSAVDFEEVATDAKRGDFVYLDPPYVPVNPTSNFTSYTKGGFGLADQERLVAVAAKLKKRGVHVLLSNADLPLVRKLYKGFEMRRVEARRNVNSNGSKRGAVGELLIW